jgi:hypothetical protein
LRPMHMLRVRPHSKDYRSQSVTYP